MLWECCGIAVGLLWHCYGGIAVMGLLWWDSCQNDLGLLWNCCGIAVRLLWDCCGGIAAGLLWECSGIAVGLL